MTKDYIAEFETLPLEQIEEDPNQPRSSVNTDGDRDRLLVSIKAIGLQQPLAVMRLKGDKYKLIDGHRRYRCAKELGVKDVPCHVYPELPVGEMERVRYEVQNNRRPWKPLERADALARIKKVTGKGSKEIAELLFVSETLVSNSLKLNKQREDYKKLMEQYDLPISYQVEFVKLLPKLRPIEEFEIDEIVSILFEKVGYKIIGSAKDFRTLGRIFLRATINKKHILEFLKDPDMTVKALELDTIQSGFSLQIEKVVEKVHERKSKDSTFSQKEEVLLRELQKELQGYFS